MTLETLFLLIKKHLEIKDIEIFEHCFLYAASADDVFSEIFTQSIVHLVEKFNSFCRFSELKPNLTQCKIAGTGALKRAQLGSKCIIYVMKLLKI